ncbi:MAG: hypothetical protein AAFY63_12825 [Cyanobacteria bacterium J06643_13]
MSIAGKKSSQGDEYQLRIALYWLIRLLDDNHIQGIQVNSTGVPGEDYSVTVDDIVVLYKDNSALFIQAKKNQTGHKAWTLSDKTLKEELINSRDQLESKNDSEVRLYSRSPFGELKSLVEVCRDYPDYSAFTRDGAKKQVSNLKRLSKIFERSEEVTYDLAIRISFGPTNEFEDWDRCNLNDLDRIIPQAKLAISVLERYLVSHEATLRSPQRVITGKDVWKKLSESGLSPTPKRSEAEILKDFQAASKIGREWLRTIDGETIPRKELEEIIDLIEKGDRNILVTDSAGSGKTCLLLDLAEHIENYSVWELLFIKGDLFDDASSEEDLTAKGLPEDIVGQCSRLAEFRHVVVILDSLDVLSIARQHKALKLFIGLMDRLANIDNLTLVTACRTFDLEYDPLLRGRSWQHKINLQPLDFETIVCPFLQKWGIEPSKVSSELRELLRIPQNLSLYGKLAKLEIQLQPTSAYELCNCFLEETVVKNLALGESAIAALQSMADSLMEQRTQQCSKTVFKVSEDVVRQLISQEILLQPKSSPNSLRFSHQTLADCLVVRSNLAAGKTLADFILAHPQLPYIRPAVRTFFFFLRTQEAKVFRKQVWQVINHDDIAYHVKRLVCESFAEITPCDEDWRLLRRIFQHHPDLFQRLFWRVRGEAWFEMLCRYWLPEVKLAEDKETWLRSFVHHLQEWAKLYPREVISLWRESIDRQWAEKQNLLRLIQSNLMYSYKAWDTEGVRELLEILVEEIEGKHNKYMGNVLSKWVSATNSGDDLLWRYITKDFQDTAIEDLQYGDLNHKLRCSDHDFCQENFLEERLCQSDYLLTLVITSIRQWKENDKNRYLLTLSLHDTSWQLKHSSPGMMHSADDLTQLLHGLEKAFKHRAISNDSWWQENEPHLRSNDDDVIRYFVIQAYKENIEANIAGAEFQLLDEELLNGSNLRDELGELMKITCPLILPTVRTKNQQIILSWISTKDNDEKPYWIKICYDYLIWIPTIFRTLETQSFIERWQGSFGYTQPFFQEHSRGGCVAPPLSSEELLQFSEEEILRLLNYYRQNPTGNRFDGILVGGLDSVLRVLVKASSLHPQKFFALFTRFITENLHPDFLVSIVEGISDHLKYRFGNLRPSTEWNPIEPLPDGKDVAFQLLNLLERYDIIWSNRDAVAEAIRACSYVIEDLESAERITLLLFWLRDKDLRLGTNRPTNINDDLLTKAINSVRGVASGAAIILCNRLLEQEKPIPELLPHLLRHFSQDSTIFVRAPIVARLPYLIHKSPELGWQLLEDCFVNSEPKLWQYVERCLYYEYRDSFSLVKPYLDRLFNEAMEEAGDTWGRISALASLAGHISQEELFQNLACANSKAWKGVAEVFVANYEQHYTDCHNGIMNILRSDRIIDKILRILEGCFNHKKNKGRIGLDLAKTFLQKLPLVTNGIHISHFLEWLALEAHRNPQSVFDLVEFLAMKIEREQPPWYGNSKSLITMLNAILREADELDDPKLIQEAIALQDRFLTSDIGGMEEMLNSAAQS